MDGLFTYLREAILQQFNHRDELRYDDKVTAKLQDNHTLWAQLRSGKFLGLLLIQQQ